MDYDEVARWASEHLMLAVEVAAVVAAAAEVDHAFVDVVLVIVVAEVVDRLTDVDLLVASVQDLDIFEVAYVDIQDA